MAKKLDQITKRFRASIEAQGISVKQLVLFGSYAENREREGSDIDIAVISEDFKKKSYWQRIDLLSKAIFDVMEPIEAVSFTPEEWEKQDTMICQFAHGGKPITA